MVQTLAVLMERLPAVDLIKRPVFAGRRRYEMELAFLPLWMVAMSSCFCLWQGWQYGAFRAVEGESQSEVYQRLFWSFGMAFRYYLVALGFGGAAALLYYLVGLL